MLYLEDYLEVIEHLPQELRDRFTEMREMDLQVHNAMDGLDEQVKQFFANAKKMKPDQKDAEYARIKQEYFKTLEDAEEKVHMANQICELVEKYSRRLDQEIKNFTMELEADNPGRAEVLKATSLELDNPPHQAVNHVRERRKHSMHNSSQLSNSISNAASHLAASTAGTANGNPLVSSSLTGSAATMIPASVGAASVIPHPSPLGYIGAGNTAIAAAASQAIAATQQMQQGRRTASLKASYEFVNAGLQTISCDFNPLRDSSMSNAVNSGILSNGEGASAGLHRATKRSRTSSQFHDTDESSEAGIDANGEQIDWNFDPNEPRYCLCNQVSYGDMVACDNEDCQYEWFHYGCVGITQPPKGKWFCPPCTNVMKKKSRKS